MLKENFQKADTIHKNFIFQIVYQLVTLLIPLFLTPILTRSLGKKGLGTFSYVNSIVYFFVIFANLGIMRHGQRIVSNFKNNQLELRKKFWSLFFLHILVSMIVLIIYVFFIILFVKENTIIFWINLLYIFSALFDVTWLFYGLEKFKTVVIVNLIVKLFYFFLIILLVKNPSDLNLYAIIETGSLLLSNLLVIPIAIKNIPPIKICINDLKEHIKPLFLLTLVVLAVALYSVFDKTLLGLMSTKESVALYECSNKIINVPRSLISVIGTVLFPKACFMASSGDVDGQKKYAEYSYIINSLISMASVFGLMSISDLFSTIYFGTDYNECGLIIKLMSPIILLVGINSVFLNVYLIPQKKDVQFVIIQFANAAINIVLSIILIPTFGVYGAVLGTLSAELSCLLLVMFVCRKKIDFKSLLKPVVLFFIPGIIMWLVIFFINNLLPFTIFGLILRIIIGAFIFLIVAYFSISIFYKEIKSNILKIIIGYFRRHDKNA